jgi:hypothetical protein
MPGVLQSASSSHSRQYNQLKGGFMRDFGILGLVHLAIWVYAVIQIFNSSARTGEKVLWIIIVAVLPLLGIIAWYFLGPGSPKK